MKKIVSRKELLEKFQIINKTPTNILLRSKTTGQLFLTQEITGYRPPRSLDSCINMINDTRGKL